MAVCVTNWVPLARLGLDSWESDVVGDEREHGVAGNVAAGLERHRLFAMEACATPGPFPPLITRYAVFGGDGDHLR